MTQTETSNTTGKSKGKRRKTVPAKERRAIQAAKKARQRATKRARGLREMSVWCLPEHAQAVRDFVDSLPQPPELPAEEPEAGPLLGLMEEGGQSNEQAGSQH